MKATLGLTVMVTVTVVVKEAVAVLVLVVRRNTVVTTRVNTSN
jgi:hypothetical protein